MTRQVIAREASRAISEKTILPITVSLLLAGVLGVWALAIQVANFSHRLDRLEHGVIANWTFSMEREIWWEFSRLNPTAKAPDPVKVRKESQ